MSIAATLPTVSHTKAELLQPVRQVLAFLAAASGAAQKNFLVVSSDLKLPQPSFLDHKTYNPTTKLIEVDHTTPIEIDQAEVNVVVEGFVAALNDTFLSGACPVEGAARLWVQMPGDATGKVRMLSSEFNCYAYLSSNLALARDTWTTATITLRVNGTKPTYSLDASAT